MLSIAIPIYNENVNELINQLHTQCKKACIPFELLCMDDASEPTWAKQNETITQFEEVKYKILTKNIGRSRIRNLLAKEAKFDRILFLDCDSSIIDPNFISNYLPYLHSREIVSGGRKYSEQRPHSNILFLHWKYGSTVESKSLSYRQRYPYQSFHSNNFLSSKLNLATISFDENLEQYGYEDSLWAMQLSKSGIAIIHIENPVEHLGLVTNTAFLRRQSLAVANLVSIEKTNPELIKNKISLSAKRLSQIGLKSFFLFCYKKSEKKIVLNLLGLNPNLNLLSIYKLGLYIRFSKE